MKERGEHTEGPRLKVQRARKTNMAKKKTTTTTTTTTCEQSPPAGSGLLLWVESANMNEAQRSCWFWAGILHNSKRFWHVNNNKKEKLHNNILKLPPPPSSIVVSSQPFCVRVCFSFLKMFRKVKSQMQIRPPEAVDTRSHDFSCVRLRSPLSLASSTTPEPPKRKEKGGKLPLIQFVWALSDDTQQSSTCGTRTWKSTWLLLKNLLLKW